MASSSVEDHAKILEMSESVWRAAVLEELKAQTELINRNQRYVAILVLVVLAQIAAMLLCGTPLF